jgi:hypothetical protein
LAEVSAVTYTHCFLAGLESVLRAARAHFAAEGDDCHGVATAADAGVDLAMMRWSCGNEWQVFLSLRTSTGGSPASPARRARRSAAC